jgi:hypothetical protein
MVNGSDADNADNLWQSEVAPKAKEYILLCPMKKDVEVQISLSLVSDHTHKMTSCRNSGP